MPGGRLLLQALTSEAAGVLEVTSKGADGVLHAVKKIGGRQQFVFLGRKQEDEPHKHGHGTLVDEGRGQSIENRGRLRVSMRPVKGEDEQFDCSPHLAAQRVGDFGFGRLRPLQQRLRLLVGACGKELPSAEDRPKRVEVRPFGRETGRPAR